MSEAKSDTEVAEVKPDAKAEPTPHEKAMAGCIQDLKEFRSKAQQRREGARWVQEDGQGGQSSWTTSSRLV